MAQTWLGGNTLTSTYRLDPLQRIDQASYPSLPGGPSATTISYQLDAFGNRLSDGTSVFSYDAADRISNNPSFQYDANGNLLSDGTTSYSYDAANRLVQTVSGGVTTSYGYDGWGTLVRETVNGVTTDFVLDEQPSLPRILAAIRSDGTSEQYAYGPDGLAAQRTGLAVHYPLLDVQASVRNLTDASGAVTMNRSYDAWGVLRQHSGSGTSLFGYTGELQRGDMVYLRARWYHTGLGRFTSRDPFEGVPTRPLSLNKYLYTEGNPVNWTDPSGRCVPQGHFFGDPGCVWFWQRPQGWDAHEAFSDLGARMWNIFRNIGLPGAIAGDWINALRGTPTNMTEEILQADQTASVLGGLFRDVATGGRLPIVGQAVAGWAFTKSVQQSLRHPAPGNEAELIGSTIVLILSLNGNSTPSLPGSGGGSLPWSQQGVAALASASGATMVRVPTQQLGGIGAGGLVVLLADDGTGGGGDETEAEYNIALGIGGDHGTKLREFAQKVNGKVWGDGWGSTIARFPEEFAAEVAKPNVKIHFDLIL